MNYKIEQGGLWELGGEIIAIFDAGRGRAREERSCRAWRFEHLLKCKNVLKKNTTTSTTTTTTTTTTIATTTANTDTTTTTAWWIATLVEL